MHNGYHTVQSTSAMQSTRSHLEESFQHSLWTFNSFVYSNDYETLSPFPFQSSKAAKVTAPKYIRNAS